MAAAYGIIGYPLLHSFSPAYFARKFEEGTIEASYELFELKDITSFAALLRQRADLRGLNVTIPHKRSIIPYLDELDEVAAAIGSVNCITICDGKTKGYNTDHFGFRNSLKPLLQAHHTTALVLGTGGSSLAVAYTLDALSIRYQGVSRDSKPGAIPYRDLTAEMIFQHNLIINTTPLGMHPNEEDYPPIPYEAIGSRHLLYDLIYNPAATKFLQMGAARGASVKNGLEMLHIQAEASWEIWHNQPTV